MPDTVWSSMPAERLLHDLLEASMMTTMLAAQLETAEMQLLCSTENSHAVLTHESSSCMFALCHSTAYTYWSCTLSSCTAVHTA